MKRMCGFAVSHVSCALLSRIAVVRTYAAYHAIVTARVVWSVGLSVALSLRHTEPYKSTKAAEAIELPFGFRTRVDARNHALHGVEIHPPQLEGAILRGNERTIVKYRDTLMRSSVQTRLNPLRCRLSFMGSHWPRHHVLDGGPDRPW